jgi:A/G-specific adenine glycosylase
MVRRIKERENIAGLRRELLAWYAVNRRDLPWRQTRDPYAIWVSEIMLQQTRVAVVVERYRAFLKKFPTVGELAIAPVEEVLALWSGLGYYRRARMLHQAAMLVANEMEGEMPATAEGLRVLPGIGGYTAAAIASIAHGEAVAVVDGNVERVLCRVAGWDNGAQAEVKRRIQRFAAELVDPAQPGDFNQAMMELGATVCLPRNPQCLVCPLNAECKTRGEHKTEPRARMVSREAGYALVVRMGDRMGIGSGEVSDEVLLEQRTALQTVMPGLWELPTLRDVNVPREDLRMTVRHAIMQVNYTVRIRAVGEGEVELLTVAGGERRWVALDEAARMALTGLTRKVLARAGLLRIAEREKIPQKQWQDVV